MYFARLQKSVLLSSQSAAIVTGNVFFLPCISLVILKSKTCLTKRKHQIFFAVFFFYITNVTLHLKRMSLRLFSELIPIFCYVSAVESTKRFFLCKHSCCDTKITNILTLEICAIKDKCLVKNKIYIYM